MFFRPAANRKARRPRADAATFPTLHIGTRRREVKRIKYFFQLQEQAVCACFQVLVEIPANPLIRGAFQSELRYNGLPVRPGEILREDILPALSMSKTAIAAALGISRQTLYDILNEKQPVTAEMAVRFGKLFGNGAGFWINLQRIYDLALAERRVDVSGIPTLEAAAG